MTCSFQVCCINPQERASKKAAAAIAAELGKHSVQVDIKLEMSGNHARFYTM